MPEADVITVESAFFLTGADLDALVHGGSAVAAWERARRSVKRAAKVAARRAASA